MKQSIPTVYAGIRFRSKLEADWARAFDAIGVFWEYEKQGYYFGNTFYLPDFFLPHSKQWVEVKGEWEPADLKKAYALLRFSHARPHTSDETPDMPLIAANPDGVFWGLLRPHGDFHDFLLDSQRALLLQCGRCRQHWFAAEFGGWTCQCCGAPSEGNTRLEDAITSPITPWPAFVREAA